MTVLEMNGNLNYALRTHIAKSIGTKNGIEMRTKRLCAPTENAMTDR